MQVPRGEQILNRVADTVIQARHTAQRTWAQTKDAVIEPEFLEKYSVGATRTGQVMALLFVPFIITVTFPIIYVMNRLMAQVLGTGTITGDQFSIISFLVTLLTLTLFIMCAWGWFQWVRTAGFGAFRQ